MNSGDTSVQQQLLLSEKQLTLDFLLNDKHAHESSVNTIGHSSYQEKNSRRAKTISNISGEDFQPFVKERDGLGRLYSRDFLLPQENEDFKYTQPKPDHLRLKISKLTKPGPNAMLIKKNGFVFFDKGSRNKRVSLVDCKLTDEDSHVNKTLMNNKTILADIESLKSKQENSRCESLKNIVTEYGPDESLLNNISKIDVNIDINGHLKQNRTKMEARRQNIAASIEKSKIKTRVSSLPKFERLENDGDGKSLFTPNILPPLGLYHPKYNIISTKSPSWKISELQRFPDIKNPYWSQEERDLKKELKAVEEIPKREKRKEDDSEFQRDFSRMMNSLKKEAENGSKNKTKVKRDPVIEKHEEFYIKPIESDEYLFKFHSDMRNGIKQSLEVVKYPREEKMAKEKEFEVEKIVEKQIKNKKIRYLIKWKGYSEKFNSWEPKSNLLPNALNLLNEFEKNKKEANNKKADKPEAKSVKPKASQKKETTKSKKHLPQKNLKLTRKKPVLLKKTIEKKILSQKQAIPVRLSRPGSFVNKDVPSKIVCHKKVSVVTKSKLQLKYLVSWINDDKKVFKRDSLLGSDELRKNNSELLINYLEAKL